jgi:hypothetical protein
MKKENRPKVSADPQMGTRGTKDNSECASLRQSNLPKPEKVTTIQANVNPGAAVKCAVAQGSNNNRRTLANSDNGC